LVGVHCAAGATRVELKNARGLWEVVVIDHIETPELDSKV